MKLNLPTGKYVAAISGGVDSMVMLDLLAREPKATVIVAHFDHGIRSESLQDAKSVAERARALNLPFELGHAQLGTKASEASAREARYKFLEDVRKQYGAKAILTAHHQDDLIETAIINLSRGTGWRGLVAMLRNSKVIRPLAHIPKSEIVDYANKHNLKWHEDSTNKDKRYLRNHIRQEIMPKLKAEDRAKLLASIMTLAAQADDIEQSLMIVSRSIKEGNKIDRREFVSLPSMVADELMADWLKQAGAQNPDRKTISRLSVAVKSAANGTKHDAGDGLSLEVGLRYVRLL